MHQFAVRTTQAAGGPAGRALALGQKTTQDLPTQLGSVFLPNRMLWRFLSCTYSLKRRNG